MFDIDKFRTRKYYIHTPTLEIFKEVLGFLEEHDEFWGGSRRKINKNKADNIWHDGKEDTTLVYGSRVEGTSLDLEGLFYSTVALSIYTGRFELPINKEYLEQEEQ